MNLRHSSPSPEDGDYLLWLGPILDESTLQRSPAASPAAARWQFGLVQALQDLGQSVFNIGHVPERLWPKGRLFMGRSAGRLPSGIAGRIVRYVNAPFIRRGSLHRRYLHSMARAVRKRGRPSAVVTYNAYPHNAVCGLRAVRDLNVPWVCIAADAPGETAERKVHDAILAQASGRVLLSWGLYRDTPGEPRLHLDGGIEEIRFAPSSMEPQPTPVILYTGALTKWGGVSLLIDAFALIRSQSAELWICGHGNDAQVREAAQANPRIKWLGMVSEEKLREVSEAASVFVNPRPPEIKDNAMNFPSKVLEYLSYGRPVVSTWTDGLSPDYRDALIVLQSSDPEALASEIDTVLSWDTERLRLQAQKAHSFLQQKLWSRQAERFLKWMETVRV
ncbi:MAG: glycosyltransferase family 4 protein [Armatimonadetes bacterium]|nr:glycosyltransferase family 4 protein [Armatimonadota bacterium]